MTELKVSMSRDAGRLVLNHLRSGPERVAFLRGVREASVLKLGDAMLVGAAQVEIGEWHVSLTDDAQHEVLRWATGAEVLAEAHSHGALGPAAEFSSTDLDGLSEWVPHIRWRLPGVLYVALVHGADSFDGLAWPPEQDHARPITEVMVDGDDTWVATGRSYERLTRRGNDE